MSTQTILSFISICGYNCIPTKTQVRYNSNKPWFTEELGVSVRQGKDNAYREVTKDLYRLKNRIKAAKDRQALDSSLIWKAGKPKNNN